MLSDYWVGVITGLGCSIILTVCVAFVEVSTMKDVIEQQKVLEQRQQKLEDWYEENKTVMQTYKFFNQSWQAIIDLRNSDNKVKE